MTIERRSPDYGVGAFAIVAAFAGIAIIAYSMNWIDFVFYNLPAWIFGPLGIYTIAYSLLAGKDSAYYLVWGTVMVAVAVVSGFYVSIFPVIGILLIVLAIIGIVVYWRGKK